MKATSCSISELSESAIAALRGAEVLADRVVLRCGTLPKDVYAEVDQALTRLGGRWNGRKGAHMFDLPIADQLGAILSGERDFPAANPWAFFATPDELAAAAVSQSIGLKALPAGAIGLEPSAGRAALIRAVRAVRPDIVFDACEINPINREVLTGEGIALIGDDFMAVAEDKKYDLIVANPPFSIEEDKFAWATHLEKMLRMLKPEGVLIAVLPSQIEFIGKKRIASLRARIMASGRIVPNDPKAFVESGTNVKTVTVYFGPAEGRAESAADAQPIMPSKTIRSLDECVRGIQDNLHSALQSVQEMAVGLPGVTADLATLHGPVKSIKATATNVYWRNVTGPVIDAGPLWVDENGAVIYWTGAEASEAQGWLARKASEPRPSKSPADLPTATEAAA